LQIYEAELLDEGSFDEPTQGCWGVMHVASPVDVDGVTDPMKQLVEPAKQGTLNVLKSCVKAKIKKLVVTSSFATIGEGDRVPGKHQIVTEEDHNTSCSLEWDAYSFSKVEAEKALIEFVDSLPEEEKFPYATLHPPLVLGPQQSNVVTSSNLVVKMLLAGEYPLCPPLHWATVDVRDLASAHVHCLESPKAQGRYIVSNSAKDSLWMYEMGGILSKHFPGYNVPTREMPVALLKLVSYVDKRITPERLDSAGKEFVELDSSKIEKELGFKYEYKEHIDRTLVDAAQSMIDLGIVK